MEITKEAAFEVALNNLLKAHSLAVTTEGDYIQFILHIGGALVLRSNAPRN